MKILLDTNLLILLVVGRTDPAAITRHKRCSAFTEEDLDLLDRLLLGFHTIVVTPNIVTEASNLLMPPQAILDDAQYENTVGS